MKAHLYPSDEEPYDQRDESYVSSEDNESYYCEICDRDFPTEDSLLEHNKGHKLCGIDGCTFSAHPLLIEKHITMQHSSGLYHRIKNVSTPEDIKKWLMERKKRYPTKANIDLRKAEIMEKEQRGEIIKQKQNVTKRKKKKALRSHNRKRTTQNQSIQIFSKSTQQVETYRGLHEFSGTLNLGEAEEQPEDQTNDGSNENENEKTCHLISDEEEIPVTSTEPIIPTTCISNLVANYGSDSEESDGPEELPIKKVRIDNDIRIEKNNSKSEDRLDKNTVINNTHLNTNTQEYSNPQLPICLNINSKFQNKRSTDLSRHSKEKRQIAAVSKKQPYTSQLLEKLLSRSIQHERNLICQCVKYIVDNNFFD